VAAFLEARLQELEGRFVVVWDGGSRHRGDPIRQLTSHFAARLSREALPPWAPTLNPVDSLWGGLKYDQWCNFAPWDALQLKERVIAELTAIREDQTFLRNLYHASELPIPRTLLS
jgi:LmbE family N-acetylglucosaminyl deacetylase